MPHACHRPGCFKGERVAPTGSVLRTPYTYMYIYSARDRSISGVWRVWEVARTRLVQITTRKQIKHLGFCLGLDKSCHPFPASYASSVAPSSRPVSTRFCAGATHKDSPVHLPSLARTGIEGRYDANYSSVFISLTFSATLCQWGRNARCAGAADASPARHRSWGHDDCIGSNKLQSICTVYCVYIYVLRIKLNYFPKRGRAHLLLQHEKKVCAGGCC